MNTDYVKAVKMQTKVTKLANMKASYRFRLAAITAADNRPGKVWK
ncbi:hypothetical protein [Marinobacter nauticus]|uniref:Uncharacterized protein n=1 Tax=Marinobacter nauticus TaxID=2743 RepID=A0A833N9U8_MARNT|nr:hypothetical protein [Marinobacter nauticus]KAE8546187.1 hypothetical protein F6453_1433 [Marinobacter nauticus]